MGNKTNITCSLIGVFLGILVGLSARAESVSAEALNSDWAFYGTGLQKVEQGMFYMKENLGSKGVMMVSPEAFGRDVTVRYEIMPMSAASVCVVILSASDAGDGKTLTLPAGYDGAMQPWVQHVNNYFFAFHNAAHNRTPFAVRFPDKKEIGQHGVNVMRAGGFHAVEAGRRNGRLWLKIDGVLLFEGLDEQPLSGGHVAFRIRGISEEPASCLIRNVEIDDSAADVQ